jgi:hypothetical protein
MHHMIAFVKDEGNNLISMVTTLCSIVNYRLLKLQQVYEGMCLVTLCLKFVSMLLMMKR